MKNTISSWMRVAAVAAVTIGASTAGNIAQADEVADFYADKTLTVLIGHPPGGSYDLYSQLVAQHFSKFIPGNPSVVVQSMPGGGGSLAAAFFANKAPRDGTMVALIPESLAHTQLLEPERSRWDIGEMRYIGRLADVTSVMMVREGAPAKTIEEMKTTPINVSCSGRTTSSAQSGAVLKAFVDVDFNMVCGYDSATASILAVFRGEADATTTIWTTWQANYSQQIEDGEVLPVVQFGGERLADLPDTPTAMELTDDPAEKRALRFFGAGGDIGRSLLAPPEMPDDRYQALVDAFQAMVKDSAFLEDAKKRTLPINPATAEQVNATVAEIFETPPEVIELLKTGMESGFDQ